MLNVSEVVQNFKEFIKSKGLKYTPEREEILREILTCKEHFDVDELYMKLKKREVRFQKLLFIEPYLFLLKQVMCRRFINRIIGLITK